MNFYECGCYYSDDADAGVEEEQKEGEEPKEEEQQPEVEEPNREEETAEAEEEPEDKIAAIVQYQLLFDAKEVEELVHRCQPADGVETLDGDEDAPVDDEEVHQEVEEVITQEETENADKGPDVVWWTSSYHLLPLLPNKIIELIISFQ